jgi:hypothetical protein
MISISETWLKEDEADHYVIKGYVTFSQCRNNRVGGGVLLFVRASLDPLPVSLKYNGVKCNVVNPRLEAVTPSLVICSAYRPPDTDGIESEQLRQYNASIRLISKDLIVAGDFNYPHIN